jgi:hypothetical protein
MDYIEAAFELDVVSSRDAGFGITPTWDGVVPCEFVVTDDASDTEG